MKKSIVVLFILITVSLAESLTLGEYMNMKEKGDPMVSVFISGLIQGVANSNGLLKEFLGKPFYCKPDNLMLNQDNYKQIIDDFIKKAEEELIKFYSDQPAVGLMLIMGLQETFPCDKK